MEGIQELRRGGPQAQKRGMQNWGDGPLQCKTSYKTVGTE